MKISGIMAYRRQKKHQQAKKKKNNQKGIETNDRSSSAASGKKCYQLEERRQCQDGVNNQSETINQSIDSEIGMAGGKRRGEIDINGVAAAAWAHRRAIDVA